MLELTTLDEITLLAESSDLECKRATGQDGKGELPKDFWETYSAMANTDGGTVLLGMRERAGQFELVGIQQVDKVRQDLFNTANNRSKVSANLLSNADVQVCEIDGCRFLQINIRRASRAQRPVYLNNNPLGNTFVRRHEGDQRLADDAVKRMLAEQSDDSRDSGVLTGYGLDDLSGETIRVYRQVFSNRQPEHPWNELETRPFLQRIGAWRVDRETRADGLTAAGLLMFGFHTTIQEAYPNYMLDYQERPEAKTERRWIDRLTLDGSWSGNLYDFYRKVYPKLTEDVKVPFELSGDQRVDDSPIHVAIREALCNALVHADYADRASVLVVKRPDMFGFRNPGMMRIPVAIALQGGHADCRNRLLHQMFRYVGIGDQAGSGIPKILSSWHQYHWRAPELVDSPEPYDQTIMRMRMIDLFPMRLVEQLRRQFGGVYDTLPHEQRAALAIAALESTVTHQRLRTLVPAHPSDASQHLHQLVSQGLLEQTGSSRGAVYHLSGMQIPGPDDVFGSPNLASSSPNSEPSSPNLAFDSPNSASGLPKSSGGQTGEIRDDVGRLISDSHTLPFVETLEKLTPEFLDSLVALAFEPRQKKRIPREVMRQVLFELLQGQFVTISCLAELVSRDPETLRGQYLTQMVRSGELDIAFPRTPNDPRQAYTKASA